MILIKSAGKYRLKFEIERILILHRIKVSCNQTIKTKPMITIKVYPTFLLTNISDGKNLSSSLNCEDTYHGTYYIQINEEGVLHSGMKNLAAGSLTHLM